MSDSKNYIGKLFKSFKKAKKRNYNEAFSQDRNKNVNNIDKKNIINLNINNNNYVYINNNIYNVNSEEKFGYDFSKNKRLKEY